MSSATATAISVSSKDKSTTWWASAWIGPLVAVAAYLHTCWFTFVLDDEFVVAGGNSITHRLGNIPSFFVTDAFQKAITGVHSRYFRPLYWTAFAVDYSLFGLRAWGHHLVNVLAHALVCWLVYRLALALALDRRAAALASVLFALHPAHVEVLAWVASLGEMLMLAFLLASFVFYIDFRKHGGAGRIALAAAMFLLALWSKEMAIVLPLLVVLYEAAFGRLAEAFRPRVLIAFGSALAVYLAFRSIAIPGLYSPDRTISPSVALLTVPEVLGFYIGHLLFPISQSTYYDQYYVVNFGRQFWMPVMAVVATFAAVVFGLRRSNWNSLYTFCALGATFSILPVLDVRAFSWRELAHDRYLYLPSVFFCVAVATLLCRMRWAKARPVAIGGLVIGYAVILVVATLAWRNPLAVYARGVETAPSNVRPRYGYATEMLARGNRGEAARQFTEIIKWAPNWFEPRFALAEIALTEGRYADAERYGILALQVRPDANADVLLAAARMRMGNFAGAEPPLRDAIVLSPATPGLRLQLGRCLAQLGRTADAADAFKAELTLGGRYSEAAGAELANLSGPTAATK